MNWPAFLAWALKNAPAVPQIFSMTSAIVEAEFPDKWPTTKPLGDFVWPIIVELREIATHVASGDADVQAMEADIVAAGLRLDQLRKLYELLAFLAENFDKFYELIRRISG